MTPAPDWEPKHQPERSPSTRPQPMRLGQVLDVGVRILRRHWAVALVLALLFAGPGALLTAATGMRFAEVAGGLLPIDEGVIDSGVVITQAELSRVVDAVVPYLGATLVAGLLASIGALAFSAVVAADYHARRPSLGGVLRTCLRRTPSALVFMFLTSLICFGLIFIGVLGVGAATLIFPTASVSSGGPGVFLALVVGVALVVALVYLTMRWAAAFPAMIEEDIGWRAALSRSWFLSGDNVWRILAISLLAALTTAVVASVLSQLLDVLLVGAIAPTFGLDTLVASSIALALGSTLMAPLVPVLTAVLYFDLRARRDLPAPEPIEPVPYP